MKARKKKDIYKNIEYHLRNYRFYKSAIRNLQQQLEYIMPNITANYELREGGKGTFSIESSTEKAAIDRIESRRALNIAEDKKRYELIISCIDNSCEVLSDMERTFVEKRYFEDVCIDDVAGQLGYSVPYMYKLRNQIMKNLSIPLSGLKDL